MFSAFKKGLAKIASGIQSVFTRLGDRPSAETLEELQALLLAADVGPATTEALITEISGERLKGRAPAVAMRELLTERLKGLEAPLPLGPGLQSILIVGINGAGKTTTVAKLAHQFKAAGRNPIIGSADTFRVAANTQLATWAERTGVPLIESKQGADPAAVAFDALQAAQSRGHDTLIIDTAGRLQTKEALMGELSKIERVMKKLDATAPQHRLLVLDGSLGLNSLAQAQAFTQVVPLTGLIITKLDGSAKAGVVIPLWETLKLPVYYVGLGEGIGDLQPFSLSDYLEGFLG